MNNLRSIDRVVVLVAPLQAVSILRALISGLPSDFPAALIIQLHEGSGQERPVALNLNTNPALMVFDGSEGMMLQPGRGYVVRTDQRLALGADGGLVCAYGSDADVDAFLLGEEHGLGSNTAEPLLESLAQRYGPRAIAVALTLLTPREVAGFERVRECGGHTIALDEAEFLWTSPPEPRVKAAPADEVLSASAIGSRMLQMLLDPEVVQAR